MTSALADPTRQTARPSAGADDVAPQFEGSASISPAPSRALRSELIDLATLAVLGALGLYGFGSAYGGSMYFLAGAVGLSLGLAVAWWGAHTARPLIVVVAATVLAFFVFGGAVAVPRSAVAGFLPSPAVAADLVDGAVQGWVRLLTMNPPVGDTANLLVVPYLCGLIAGVTSLSVALRTRRPALALPIPLAVLVLSILFGTKLPASLLLQGTLFGVISLWWIAHIQRSRRRVETGTRRSRRWIGVVAMLSVAGTFAHYGWRHMPGATSNDRLILSDYVEPPFDPANHPSPLIEYRRYTNGENEDGFTDPESSPTTSEEATEESPTKRKGWRSTALFAVDGLPTDQRLRLATLDTYDGLVYSVGSGPRSSGAFERVGEQLPPPLDGESFEGTRHDVTVEILGDNGNDLYRDIWLPVPDRATAIRFDTSDQRRTEELAESLLWNSATGTAVVGGENDQGETVRVAAGDTYSMTAIRAATPDRKRYVKASAAKVVTQVQELQPVSSAARDLARAWGCKPPTDPPTTETPIDPTSVYDRVLLIAQGLKVCGGLSDGASNSGIPAYPGHGASRLNGMVGDDSDGMLGNGEQFAPLAALLANASGVPSRVVMGFRSQDESSRWREEHGLAAHDTEYIVRGSDIAAWIEVALDRGDGTEWVPVLDVTPTKPVPQLRPAPQPLDPDSDPPPPPPSIPPSEEETDQDNCLARTEGAEGSDEGSAEDAGRAAAGTDDESTGSDCSTNETDEVDGGFEIPAWVVKTAVGVGSPLLVVGLITAAIAGLKARRRNRRRTTGDADERVNGGWLEVTDLASDLGAPVPPRVTRREAGALIGHPEATRLANHADAVVFGPGDPTETQVANYWNEVDATREAMLSGLSRFGRWKALVSLSSLRSSGQRRLDNELDRRRHADGSSTRPRRRPGRGAPSGDVAPA